MLFIKINGEMWWKMGLSKFKTHRQKMNFGFMEPTEFDGHLMPASLAQLVEQLTLNQWVAGSSPAGSTFLVMSNEL